MLAVLGSVAVVPLESFCTVYRESCWSASNENINEIISDENGDIIVYVLLIIWCKIRYRGRESNLPHSWYTQQLFCLHSLNTWFSFRCQERTVLVCSWNFNNGFGPFQVSKSSDCWFCIKTCHNQTDQRLWHVSILSNLRAVRDRPEEHNQPFTLTFDQGAWGNSSIKNTQWEFSKK